MRVISIVIMILIFGASAPQSLARSGCCSHHGGVQENGCGCNDGTALSNTCAPYYSCTAGQAPAAPIIKQTNTAPVAPVIKRPTYTPVPTSTTMPTVTPVPYQETDMDKKKLFQVMRVLDGDMIVVNIRGKEESVRLIGIDTPNASQCFGKAASDKLRGYVQGKFVKLVDDKDQGNRDLFENLLRYVYLADTKKTFINGELIKQGYGFSTKEEHMKMHTKFNNLESYAKDHTAGWWATCKVNTKKVVNPTKILP